MNYISLLSTILAFSFTLAVINRYRQKPRTHLLLWGFGLLLYGLGTLTEVISSLTFSPLVLKVWYLSGAMLTAAWLGQGTVHLLVRRRSLATSLTVVLGVVSLAALALVAAAPVTASAASYDISRPLSIQYEEILTRGGAIITMTILMNIYGTLALVGGAIYSAFIFWRKRVLANRMWGNILIAAGAMMPAMGGTFLKAGLADWLYLSEFLGVILMYAGFLQATASPQMEASPAQTAAN